jgi:predicted dehydrogenase
METSSMSDSLTTRRDFLQASAAGAALFATAPARAAAANDRIRICLVGCGGRGTHVADVFRKLKNVEVAWVCDPDSSRLGRAAESFSVAAGRAVADLRTALEDNSLDAVLVATPDHWHAPASILALDAGKHVYVEKPCSHNLREGRLLVQAAERNSRHVQHGTQSRSTGMMHEAVAMLRDGAIGTVLATRAWNIQRRGTIGRQKPSDPPAGFDYDLWVGPAPFVPYQENRVHRGWHWWYDFGTGDMGNDGVHDIDYARWGLGVDTHPTLISAVGGKYVFEDDQQFPDTQQVTFEYPGDGQPGSRRMLIYEQRLWSTNYPHNVDSGVEFYGTKGQMFLSRRGKVLLTGDRNERIDVKIAGEAQNEVAHVANFCDAVRGLAKPNAPAIVGHLSAGLCHLGNIATRLGRSLRFDPAAERFIGDDEANQHVSRAYRQHWGTPREA